MKYKKMLVVVFIVIALLVIIGIYSLNKTKVKTLDINSELVQELYKRVNPSSDGAILNNMYNDKKEFDNGYILATGFHNIIDGEEFIVQYISEKDLESSIRKVFGKNISFKHEDVYIYRDFYCGYKYNSDNKNYEFISGCDGDTNNYYYREIVDAVENKDELIITEKTIYVYYDWSESMNYVYVYNNVVDRKLIDEYSGKLESLKFDDYKDKASTYNYRFKKIGKEYIFTALELVR